jgi:hypothetical protein
MGASVHFADQSFVNREDKGIQNFLCRSKLEDSVKIELKGKRSESGLNLSASGQGPTNLVIVTSTRDCIRNMHW